MYVHVAWAHLHLPVIGVNFFTSIKFNCLFYLSFLFLKLLFPVFLNSILQICVIDLIHVRLGTKEALQVYFPI